MTEHAEPQASRHDGNAATPFGVDPQPRLRNGVDTRALGVVPESEAAEKPFGATEVTLVNGVDYAARPDMRPNSAND